MTFLLFGLTSKDNKYSGNNAYSAKGSGINYFCGDAFLTRGSTTGGYQLSNLAIKNNGLAVPTDTKLAERVSKGLEYEKTYSKQVASPFDQHGFIPPPP